MLCLAWLVVSIRKSLLAFLEQNLNFQLLKVAEFLEVPDKSLAGSVSQVPFKGVANKQRLKGLKNGERRKIHPGVRARFMGHGGWQGG